MFVCLLSSSYAGEPFHGFSTVVPPDASTAASTTCTVNATAFADWFPNGVKLDGVATEADSVNFSDIPNCAFYRWSWRMFLWLTSPAVPNFDAAGSGTRTFQSRLFYDVSSPVGGSRTLIPHPSGASNVLLPGQAENEVLMSQTGSLVYYSRQINDVLAWFRALEPSPSAFPTTQAELQEIVDLAATFDVTLPHAKALAIEVKSSWVEASTLARPDSYLTMMATIPTYDTTSGTLWTQTGTKTVLMAMTGIHVVGSTGGNVVGSITGHPEMIWATFEHLDNAPNATFTYVNTLNITVTVHATSPTGSNWLFTASGLTVPNPPDTFNNQRMFYADPDIQAVGGDTIGPSDVLRMKPWGAASDVRPNPAISTTANSNTQLISINNSVHARMQSQAAGDVRNNYFLTGATWTINGAPPTGPFEGVIQDGKEVGTSRLTNATMETFDQGTDRTANTGERNCFNSACHSGFFPSGSRVFNDLPQVAPPPACVEPPSGMVLWWPADGPAPVCVPSDVTHSGNNGAVVGPGVCPTDAKVPDLALPFTGSLSFSGGLVHFAVPDDPSLDFGTGDFSIDAWVKDVGPGSRTLVHKMGTFGFSLTSQQGQLTFTIGTPLGGVSTVPAGPSLDDGGWHHVAVSVLRSGGGNNAIKLFVDGALVQNVPNPPLGSVDNASSLLVGSESTPTPGNPALGLLDELEMFAGAVPDATFEAIFKADASGKCKRDLNSNGIVDEYDPSIGATGPTYCILGSSSGAGYSWGIDTNETGTSPTFEDEDLFAPPVIPTGSSASDLAAALVASINTSSGPCNAQISSSSSCLELDCPGTPRLFVGAEGSVPGCLVRPGIFCTYNPMITQVSEQVLTQQIPALSEWGLAVFILSMLTVGSLFVHRRRTRTTR